mgnify:CR=1 FL=1
MGQFHIDFQIPDQKTDGEIYSTESYFIGKNI